MFTKYMKTNGQVACYKHLGKLYRSKLVNLIIQDILLQHKISLNIVDMLNEHLIYRTFF